MSQKLGSSLRRKVSESETLLLALHEAKMAAISGSVPNMTCLGESVLPHGRTRFLDVPHLTYDLPRGGAECDPRNDPVVGNKTD